MKRKYTGDLEEGPERRPRLRPDSVAQVQFADRTMAMEVDTCGDMDVEMTQQHKSSFINVKVMWGRERYDVDVDLGESIETLKAQIFALTQIVPERQKIITNGKIINSDEKMRSNLRDGILVRMVGTNEVIEIPTASEEDSKSDVSATKDKMKYPPYGIKNYGNTCYMNSVLQLFRTIPELRFAIVYNKCRPDGNLVKLTETVVAMTMGELFKSLDERSDNYEKWMKEVITNVETLYPEYTGGIEKGGRPQQDANEFFVRILLVLQKSLVPHDEHKDMTSRDVVSTIFGIDIEKTVTCLEEGGEQPTVSQQTELQLSCFIGHETKFMYDGVKNRFYEEIVKQSEELKREAKFSIKSTITRLPAYVCVQMVRFYFKEKEKINAKILKDVKFPTRLDLSELCSPELKEKFKPMQQLLREYENQLSLADDDEAKKNLLKSVESGLLSIPEQNLQLGDSGTGIYQLIGVLTHQGRSTSSGHYVAWVKVQEKRWAKLDDNLSTFVDEDDILKLSGGGESHTAYLLIYQTYRIPDSSKKKT